MPKKRKIDGEGTDADDTRTYLEVEVKTEVLSQEEESREVPSDGEEKEKEEVVPKSRTLRPRKTTCYAERESPEPAYEERSKKTPRRKRRMVTSEEGKMIEEKGKDDAKQLEPEKTADTVESRGRPTLVAAASMVSPAGDTKDGSKAVDSVEDKEKCVKPPGEKKRGKRKRKAVSPPGTPANDGTIVPKTEPLSPVSSGEKEQTEEPKDPSETTKSPTKPKPKKRIRTKKISKDNKSADPAIKQEKDDNANEGEDEKGESKNDEDDEEKVAKKKPVKKKINPGAKKESSLTETAPCDNNGEEIKKVAPAKKRAKPRSRPKKAVTGLAETTEEKKEGENADQTETSEGTGNPEKSQAKPRALGASNRKSVFRGRRAKSISARAGRKEIIHQEEPIDPEDIKGFEHVERYVTPEGMKLPKFWDSEDELSEDENNDNFRRIMCGFGTNCRNHEVIRPASEIVRRLKELQNTFGITKSLPLFQKDEMDSENLKGSTPPESFLRREKERSITWHTDHGFFKYANNYPSKCK